MKYFVNILAILLLVILVVILVEYKRSSRPGSFGQATQRLVQRAKSFFEVKKHNIAMETSNRDRRKRPLTMIASEEALREYFPQVFADLSDREWNQLWDLVYEPIYVEEQGFRIKRPRSKVEIEQTLIERYPELGYFKESDWFNVWTIARINWVDE